MKPWIFNQVSYIMKTINMFVFVKILYANLKDKKVNVNLSYKFSRVEF